ncbi:MAG: Flp pilus assembly complex ATPase component TadA [Pseudomonadales bacterium]|nr:Flp pilus assembly complex ATPase component TadA [Pseudomonadales bacterium]
MKFEFDVIDSQGNRKNFVLVQGRYTLGKGEDCDVVLDDELISRHHATIQVEISVCTLEDNSSTNGTWFNGRRISQPIQFNVGDELQFGELTLVVRVIEVSQALRSLLKPESKELVAAAHGESEELIALKKKIHTLILEYLDLRKRANLQLMSPEELRVEATKATVDIIKEKIEMIPAGITKNDLVEQVVAEAVGLGALEPLLNDDEVTEVMVNGPNQIYVERDGKLSLSSTQFTSTQALMGVIDRIVAPLGRRIDESSPMVDARLPDGSRVNAVIPPLSLVGPCITIRKFSKKKLNVEDLMNYGTCSVEMALFLQNCVSTHRNIIVSGGTGSGKTTTLNILSNFIGNDERIVTIEDAAELQLNQPNLVSMESRAANAEGKGAISIRELVVNSLRMRPDRIIIGECRAGEALDMLQAMNTGHDGSLTTGHANSPKDMLARLEVMVFMAGMDLPLQAIREQIGSAIQIIIQQTRLSDGARRITSIVEVQGMEGDEVYIEPIFEYVKTGVRDDGRVLGEFVATGNIPLFYREMAASGVQLDTSIFKKSHDADRNSNIGELR